MRYPSLSIGVVLALCIGGSVRADSSWAWSGPYAGLSVGTTTGSSEISLPLSPPGVSRPDLGATAFGAEIGYRYQFESSFVVGAALTYEALSGERQSDALFGVVGQAYQIEATRQISAQIQVGYGWGRTLVYAEGGLARLTVEGCGFLPPGPCVPATDFDGDLSGWTAGLGIAYALANGWALNAEISRADFGTERFATPNVVGGVTDAEAARTSIAIGIQRQF